ncbi:hypothetical protein PAECIP111893_03021 [Paenibacillus plantiphilus]|uniref:YtkA-like domain-containing protein n=1 Tax=Paenibacillus plantiphilus TaxID=2905650 RepID=A0ABN8GQI7_9BACL|nr:FixH family protein [Paenibacillus plantiphilus]CAH1209434.1 hypothetical protein PAECIP111893_03021 [Paenibacillus plantiphilus]
MMPITKRNAARALIAILLNALLSGCTANVNSTDERGLLPHLTVDLQIPEQLQAGTEGTFTMIVHQNGEPFEAAADSAAFEIWPEGQRENSITIPGKLDGAGVYTASPTLDVGGIYVVRCRVSSTNYEVMPSKRFAIGEEAVNHLAMLEEQASSEDSAPDSGDGGHHH